MGKRSNFERREADFYPTPRAAVVPLIPHLRGIATFADPVPATATWCATSKSSVCTAAIAATFGTVRMRTRGRCTLQQPVAVVIRGRKPEDRSQLKMAEIGNSEGN